MNVTGSWWHIYNQVIEITPIDICNKLPDSTTGHRPPPYNGTFFIYQQSDAYQLYTITFEGSNHTLSLYLHHHGSFAANAEHNRYTGSINISIHLAHFCAML